MELIGYASDFVSFLIENMEEELKKVKNIVLFGSVARGEDDKNSDVDIFIDTNEDIEEKVKGIKEEFFESQKFNKYWKLRGINNDINLVIGKLEEWKLKDSMIGNAIVLYSSFSPSLEKGKNKVILMWPSIKNNSKRVMINKKIFGYKYYDRKYKGMLEKLGGEKLGANIILVSAENLNHFLKIFRSYGVAIKVRRMFEYEK